MPVPHLAFLGYDCDGVGRFGGLALVEGVDGVVGRGGVGVVGVRQEVVAFGGGEERDGGGRLPGVGEDVVKDGLVGGREAVGSVGIEEVPVVLEVAVQA